MPRKTLTQRLSELDAVVKAAESRAFYEGKNAAQAELKEQFASAKLAQMQAAVKLMEEAGRVMSRAGYMIGKINNDIGR